MCAPASPKHGKPAFGIHDAPFETSAQRNKVVVYAQHRHKYMLRCAVQQQSVPMASMLLLYSLCGALSTDTPGSLCAGGTKCSMVGNSSGLRSPGRTAHEGLESCVGPLCCELDSAPDAPTGLCAVHREASASTSQVLHPYGRLQCKAEQHLCHTSLVQFRVHTADPRTWQRAG